MSEDELVIDLHFFIFGKWGPCLGRDPINLSDFNVTAIQSFKIASNNFHRTVQLWANRRFSIHSSPNICCRLSNGPQDLLTPLWCDCKAFIQVDLFKKENLPRRILPNRRSVPFGLPRFSNNGTTLFQSQAFYGLVIKQDICHHNIYIWISSHAY